MVFFHSRVFPSVLFFARIRCERSVRKDRGWSAKKQTPITVYQNMNMTHHTRHCCFPATVSVIGSGMACVENQPSMLVHRREPPSLSRIVKPSPGRRPYPKRGHPREVRQKSKSSEKYFILGGRACTLEKKRREKCEMKTIEGKVNEGERSV